MLVGVYAGMLVGDYLLADCANNVEGLFVSICRGVKLLDISYHFLSSLTAVANKSH